MAHTCIVSRELQNQDWGLLMTDKEVYRCGGCNKKFNTICTLHDHMQTHSEGGSFFYSHMIKTAFPKHDTSCRATQTDPVNELLQTEVIQKRCLQSKTIIEEEMDYEKEHFSTEEDISMCVSKERPIKEKHTRDSNYWKNSKPEGTDRKCSENYKVKCIDEEAVDRDIAETYLNDGDDDDAGRVGDDDDGINSDLMGIEKEENMVDMTVERNLSPLSSDMQVKEGQEIATSLKIDDSDNRYRCDLCDANFRHKLTFQIHFVEYHQQGVSKFKCQLCGLVFVYKSRLVNHLRIKHKTGVNKDQKEKKRAKYRAQKLRSQKKSWPCKSCDKVYSTESGLYFHKQGKHSGEKFECELCNAEYSFKHTLRSHMIEVHNSGNEGLQCKECGKIFAYQSRLTHHQKVKHPTEKDFKECFVCEFCGKEFLVRSRLREHLRDSCINHKRKYQCPQCPYISFTKTCLREHVNNVHCSESRHMCHVCGRVFRNGHSLYIHRVVHSEERNFLCKTCNKTFKTDNQLKRHVKIHENLKSFKCDVCDKHFVQSNNLKAHMRQHTGEKPFSCDFCEQKFTHNISRKNHMSKCKAKIY